MTLGTLIRRSLRFHWRGHLGVLLGAAVGSAALIGALVVGDSVSGSLKQLALGRLGRVHFAIDTKDRYFKYDLARRIEQDLGWRRDDPLGWQNALNLGRVAVGGASSALAPNNNSDFMPSAVLALPATASRHDGSARANQVQLLGVGDAFWGLSAAAPPDQTRAITNLTEDALLLNEALAAQLRVQLGDTVVVRVRKASALSADVPLAPQSDAAVALRLRVAGIVPEELLGNFSLSANQTHQFNAFVRRETLQRATQRNESANLLLSGPLFKPPPPPRALPGFVRFALGWWDRVLPAKRQRAAPPRDPWPDDVAHAMLTSALSNSWTLPDAEQDLVELSSFGRGHQPEHQDIELQSSRIFLDQKIAAAALDPTHPPTNGIAILTYLVNQIRAGDRFTPYSIVTAIGGRGLPLDFKDDEILINQWLADDLGAKPGAEIALTYYLPESGARLLERTNRFRVRSVLPMEGPWMDRTLMPEFPGLAKAESTRDWDAGFPLVHKIREQDESYWKQYRGTPKAFVTLAAGQKMWANRFGNLTVVRWPVPAPDGSGAATIGSVRDKIFRAVRPEDVGLAFQPVRAQALAAAEQAQDFGGLFLGFSFFLIVAALILMALLFQFGLEQRTTETGTLLALGFTPRQVRRLLLREGVAVAFLGGALGALGGLGYAKGMLHLLTTLWRDAVGGSALQFHVTGATLAIGLFASVIVCAVTIWFVLRRQARRPARELLNEGEAAEFKIQNSKFKMGGRAKWVALGAGVAALALVGWAVAGRDGASAPIFFGAGALLLVAGLATVSVLLTALDRSEAGQKLTLLALGLRGCTRRRLRSLASVALLACGSFLIVAVGANRLDAGRDATKRASGTGGFALFGESTLPIVRDLNTKAGREFYGLDEETMRGVSVVPFRVRDGDEASCLNLNRAQKPRLLGVKPELLAERGAFTFAKVRKGLPADKPWELLRSADSHVRANVDGRSRGLSGPRSYDAIPAIGDAASIQWALGKKLGDTLDYTDERGQSFKVRLVAGVANSILQGNLIIDEAEFLRRFPGEAGHRMFLIDTPSNDPAAVERVSAALSRALQDAGLELTPATRRLAAFNAVQNTYLNTFQVLGGLGLLLGSMGLGVVVLRNVLERRGELGLLQAVGFTQRSIRRLVLSEHGGLLALGLAVGIVSALLAILPVLLAPGARLHATALGLTLAGVLASGLVWTWLAIRLALRGKLLDALRNE